MVQKQICICIFWKILINLQRYINFGLKTTGFEDQITLHSTSEADNILAFVPTANVPRWGEKDSGWVLLNPPCLSSGWMISRHDSSDHSSVQREVICWELNTRKGTGRWNENGLHHLILEVKESLVEKVTSDLRWSRWTEVDWAMRGSERGRTF